MSSRWILSAPPPHCSASSAGHMGAGHIAVGLALKRAEARVNAGIWIFAALLCDFLLGIFAALGLERAEGLAEYPQRHYLLFTFPYSHGLAATVLWAAAAAALAALVWKRRRPALLAAGAVLSHFVLDALVHVKGLPLAGPGSPAIGLGLWRYLPCELALEAAMVLGASILYARAVRGKHYGMVAYALIATAVLIAGQAFGSAPPRQSSLAISWIGAPPALAAIAFWIDRRSSR